MEVQQEGERGRAAFFATTARIKVDSTASRGSNNNAEATAAAAAASELFIVVTMWQTKANNNTADSLILTTF